MQKPKLIFECKNKTNDCVSFLGPTSFSLKLYDNGLLELTKNDGFTDKNFSKKITPKEIEEIKQKLSNTTHFERKIVKEFSTGGIYNKLIFYKNDQKVIFEWTDNESKLESVKILEEMVWGLIRLFD